MLATTTTSPTTAASHTVIKSVSLPKHCSWAIFPSTALKKTSATHSVPMEPCSVSDFPLIVRPVRPRVLDMSHSHLPRKLPEPSKLCRADTSRAAQCALTTANLAHKTILLLAEDSVVVVVAVAVEASVDVVDEVAVEISVVVVDAVVAEVVVEPLPTVVALVTSPAERPPSKGRWHPSQWCCVDW